MTWAKRCAVVAALTLGPGHDPLAAQAPGYLVDVWTTDDGLPQNSVNEIVQTSDGYLWLGTYGGLVRFDGVSFSLVQRTDSTGTHLDRVLDMALARGDTLWLATESGLLRYAGGVFRRWGPQEGVPALAVDKVALGEAGTVWLATRNGFGRLRNGRVETLARDSALIGGANDAEGQRWLSHGDPTALIYLEREDGIVDRVPTWDAGPLALQTADGARWYLEMYTGMVMRSDEDEHRWTRADGVTSPNQVVRDHAGRIWIGNQGSGVHLLDTSGGARGRATSVPGTAGPSNGAVHAMFVDREGTLWIGTNGDGLLRIKRRIVGIVAEESPGVITSILQQSDGRVLLGGNCTGLHVLLRGQTEPHPFAWPAGVSRNCPTALAESSDGALWVGGYGTMHRVQGGHATTLMDADGRTVGDILALYAARDGTVWGGALNGGLYAFAADGTFRDHFDAADGLGHNDIRFITEDAGGGLWIGSTGGFGRRLPDGRFEWYRAADGLPSEQVRAILPNADGTAWIGTYGGGLAHFQNGRLTPVRMWDGLSDDVVSAIIEDDAGNFWMSGNRGIFRVRRAELEAFVDGRASRVHSVLFGRTDGMLNVETNGGFQPAAWRARDGRLWFPTLRGAAIIDPAEANVAGPPPPAVIETILINGVEHEPLEGMDIESGRPALEVRYTGLGLSAPRHIAFRYRLLGYDDAWTDAGTRRVAYYPRLPPGDYRFEVIAANRDGVWGPVAGLALNAQPAVHETVWFRGSLILLLVGGLAGAAQRRVAAARRSEAAEQAFSRALMASQETERRRIAAELHDGLGQDLLLVKNYAALALVAPDAGPMREHVEKIGELATGALGSVRALAHTLTPRQLDHVGITQALTDVLRTVQEATNVAISVALDDIDDDFTLDGSIHVFRIVQEAVSNVLKHANATHLEVSVQRSKSAVRLVIRDDGRGFDARHTARGGLGLDGIRQRVGMLSGSLTIESSPDTGTCVTAVLPLAHSAAVRAADAASQGAS